MDPRTVLVLRSPSMLAERISIVGLGQVILRRSFLIAPVVGSRKSGALNR